MSSRWLFVEKDSIIYFNLDKYFLERQATARFATARGLPRQHQWCASLCCRIDMQVAGFKRDTPDTTVVSCFLGHCDDHVSHLGHHTFVARLLLSVDGPKCRAEQADGRARSAGRGRGR